MVVGEYVKINELKKVRDFLFLFVRLSNESMNRKNVSSKGCSSGRSQLGACHYEHKNLTDAMARLFIKE